MDVRRYFKRLLQLLEIIDELPLPFWIYQVEVVKWKSKALWGGRIACPKKVCLFWFSNRKEAPTAAHNAIAAITICRRLNRGLTTSSLGRFVVLTLTAIDLQFSIP